MDQKTLVFKKYDQSHDPYHSIVGPKNLDDSGIQPLGIQIHTVILILTTRKSFGGRMNESCFKILFNSVKKESTLPNMNDILIYVYKPR